MTKCKAPVALQRENCKQQTTLQRARYVQQKCATYSCAAPKSASAKKMEKLFPLLMQQN